MTKILDVYLHDKLTGQLTQNINGGLSFAYTQSYIEKNNPAISFSLPLREEIYHDKQVRPFFSNLLPDTIIRTRLARYLGVSEKNPFSLLEMIGGECAGALSLYPHNMTLSNQENQEEILDHQQLKNIIHFLKQRPLLAGEEGVRLSLAGAQDKIAVGLKNNHITLIRGHQPPTHILKPVIQEIDSSVHNELFCMRLAELLKIKVPKTFIRYVDDIPYFLIERYDRIKDINGKFVRLHQEDFCQAMGIMPEMKYEREGGPGFNQSQDLLHHISCQPAVDQMAFLKRFIFNYLIGNADGHGKNFSLLYINKKPVLSPAYDMLSTAVYPHLAYKMAMKIGNKYTPEEVFWRHWMQLVPNTMIAQRNLSKELYEMSKKIEVKAEKLKSNLIKENISSYIFDDIIAIIRRRSAHILSILPFS